MSGNIYRPPGKGKLIDYQAKSYEIVPEWNLSGGYLVAKIPGVQFRSADTGREMRLQHIPEAVVCSGATQE